jgi:hypothetical protein
VSSSSHKQYNDSTITNCEVPWPTLGFLANVGTAYRQKRKQIDLKVNDLYWSIGRKSPASLESTSIQDNHKAYLDLWNRIMGMRQQIAYSQNATKPVQNTADDQKCALVCD